jgi:hypothetical protein
VAVSFIGSIIQVYCYPEHAVTSVAVGIHLNIFLVIKTTVFLYTTLGKTADCMARLVNLLSIQLNI